MKDLLKYIPGFRSDNIWKKTIAGLYYMITLLMLAVEVSMFLFFLATPFLIFSIGDLIKARKNNKPIKTAVTMLVVSLIITSGSINSSGSTNNATAKENTSEVERLEKKKKEDIVIAANAGEVSKKEDTKTVGKEIFEKVTDLKVHYIDIGQGDSILIQLPNGQTSLIDGGPEGNSQILLNYLKEQKIEKIDYLIATHPHEDHIGGLPSVISNFEIGKVYMPEVTHTPKAFENLLLYIQKKGNKINVAKAGDMILDKESLNLSILAPEGNINDDNLNNHSVILKLKYKDNDFLFTGDAEKESESIMISKGYNLKTDVLKVGHHGSETSTTNEFLKKANPKYAIISCAKDNKYGHPHQPTIDKLNANNIEIYRTDMNGTIIATSDGEKITFEKKASPIKENAPPKETIVKNDNPVENKAIEEPEPIKEIVENKPAPTPTPPATDNVAEVYITNSGSKYHTGSCGSLSKSKIPISLEKAKASYGPCKRCSPPQ